MGGGRVHTLSTWLVLAVRVRLSIGQKERRQSVRGILSKERLSNQLLTRVRPDEVDTSFYLKNKTSIQTDV
jgi:hypothetical protein